MNGAPSEDVAHLLAINDGRLLEWLDNHRALPNPPRLIGQLVELLEQSGAATPADAHVRLIDLNSRSLVGDINRERKAVLTEFLDKLINKLLGGSKAAELWKPCRTCTALSRCQVGRNTGLLINNAPAGQRLRERLAEALQAVHQRAEVHITARELRATLSYILFGIHYCSELHARPDFVPPGYWDMAFSPDSPVRQGDVLRELTFLDPALDTHPMIDRRLSGHGGAPDGGGQAGPAYPDLPSSDSRRRRAYFEWQAEEIKAVAESSDALGLAHGRHLAMFKEAGWRSAEENVHLRDLLCRGISRLEDLPPLALDRFSEGRVPLKVPSRTPTESVFWVEKPLANFTLEAEMQSRAAHLPVLHRRVRLVYTYKGGRREILSMGYELFHTLLEIEAGFQLNDTTSDDLFANLAIFTQRIGQEGEASLLAWNPQDEKNLYQLVIDRSTGRQKLECVKAGGIEA